jgi:uncharacterized protein (DUF58 family)
MKGGFTIAGKAMVGAIVLIFISAYLFQSVLMAVTGGAFLLYLSYRRMEFNSLVRRVRFNAERKIMEDYVHKDSKCSVKIEVSANETIRINLKDTPPRSFTVTSGTTFSEGEVRPERQLSMIYSSIPKKRGYFRFQPMELTVTEMRGLFQTGLELDPGTEVLVQASKKDIQMARLMSKKKQFEVTGPAHRRHTRTYRADFKSIREYLPGDRFRDIDWKAVSRFGKLMTREFERETHLPTMIMIDLSLTMREMVESRSKMDHAIALALQIAIVMSSNGHPVGLISFDEHRVMEHLSPGKCDLDNILLSLLKLPNPILTGGYPGTESSMDLSLSDEASGFLNKVGPFLVRGNRASYTRSRTTGIFEAERSLEMTEESGMLIILLSDLETNRPSLLRSVQRAMKNRNRFVLVSFFSWPYHVSRKDLSVETVEKMYSEHRERQTLLASLRAGDVRVIDVDLKERGEKVISGIRRMTK